MDDYPELTDEQKKRRAGVLADVHKYILSWPEPKEDKGEDESQSPDDESNSTSKS